MGDCDVAPSAEAVVHRAVEALVAAVGPVVDACRGLAKVGRTGLWNEVADALGVTLVHQSLVPSTPERVAELEAALRTPGAPWRARPELGVATSPVLEERLPELSADPVMVDVSYEGEAILDHPLFQALPAAAAGQVVEFDTSELTDTYHPGTIAIARYLKEQVAMDIDTALV